MAELRLEVALGSLQRFVWNGDARVRRRRIGFAVQVPPGSLVIHDQEGAIPCVKSRRNAKRAVLAHVQDRLPQLV